MDQIETSERDRELISRLFKDIYRLEAEVVRLRARVVEAVRFVGVRGYLSAEVAEAMKIQTETIAELRRQLDGARRNNEERNKALDALRYVWCDGGCSGGVLRWTLGEIDEETVLEAERNTARLRTWWTNRKGRDRDGL